MKNTAFHRFLSALCALVLTLTLVPAARAAGTPAASNNINAHTYTHISGRPNINSYLYDNGHGLTRVENIKPSPTGPSSIVVEEYSDAFQLQSSRTIPFELSKWGGFFAGETYNFFVFGQDNPAESDSVETIRVVKYDKSWNRLGQYSLYGGNIREPFAFSTLRCAEYGGYLYIHTGRTMYKDSGGVNHQANVTLHIRESDMTRISYIDREISAGGYVSHSFDQYILVDAEQNVVTLDVGDGSPRALVVIRYDCAKAGSDPLKGRGGYWGDGTGGDRNWHDVPNTSHVWDIPGQYGNNNVHSNTGAFAETSTGYVTAFCRDDAGSGFASRKIYLGYTAKNGLQSSSRLVSPERTVSAPHLAPTGLGGGWLLWNSMQGAGGFHPGKDLLYTAYSADGSFGEIRTAKNAPLSDCAPIQYNGKTVWYTTDNSAPVFYTLDASGVTATPANGTAAPAPGETERAPTPLAGVSFTDVPATHWAYNDIASAVSLGAVSGYDDGTFRPGETITHTQFLVMITRTLLPDMVEEYRGDGTANAPWYYPYMAVARRKILCHNTDLGFQSENWPVVLNAEKPVRRYDAAVLLANYMLSILYTGFADNGGQFTDYSSFPEKYAPSIGLCVAKGLMDGMPDGSFSGEKLITRAEACTLINRLWQFDQNYKQTH